MNRSLGVKRFTGEQPEPRPGLSSGHMPHARSLPFSTLLEKHETGQGYTTVLPHDKLKETFDRAVGDGRGRSIVAVSAREGGIA
jgi:thiosulfate/3-mercaptopyruvate sulfurtransferase